RPACLSAVLILCLSIGFAILVDLFYLYRCLCCSISYINVKSSNFKQPIPQPYLLPYLQTESNVKSPLQQLSRIWENIAADLLISYLGYLFGGGNPELQLGRE